MKEKNLVLCLLLCVIACAVVLTTKENEPRRVDERAFDIKPSSDPKIAVNGNAGLAAVANGGGNGTKLNPYIIENKTIDAGSIGSAIAINNTNAYLTIRNCSLSNSRYYIYYGAGICLKNVTNTLIVNNTAINNDWGIRAESCLNITISNNAVTYNNNGIELTRYYSDFIPYSITSYNTISNNNAFYNDCDGIQVWANYTRVFGNNASYNSNEGIQICGWYNELTNNTTSWNHEWGIHLTEHHNVVSSNSIVNNENGITMSSAFNEIIGNNISNNDKYGQSWTTGFGIHLNSGGYNIISDNIFVGNTINADYHDDPGPGMIWSGNLWGDYRSRYPSATNDGIHWNVPYTIFNEDMVFGGQDNNPRVPSYYQNVTPSISHPQDSQYSQIEQPFYISWNYTDPTFRTANYSIWINDTLIDSGSWNPESQISFSDFASIGSYQYKIVVSNCFGYVIQDDVIVKIVFVNVIPLLSNPNNMNCGQFTSDNIISWTVSDANVNVTSYTIYRDNVQIASGSWYSGEPIVVSIDTFSKGMYHYKIVVNDGFDGIVQDEVIVTISENYQLDYMITALILIAVGFFMVVGSIRYHKSPASVQRRERRAEMKMIEQERLDAELKAEREAAEKVREERERLEREHVEREEREKREAEEAKMREMFKKFMAEEQGKTTDEIDKMFDEWKNKKEKI